MDSRKAAAGRNIDQGPSAVDDVLRFISFSAMLSFDNSASEDDAFQVKDCQVIVFEFICCVMR
ncbi:hypothetical protein, partial [uncultured Lamprocystis sp.]|uniref:hypothetical protein n=1 Tax=uncultured Lamprocystis sp. TaxID=543132 RepID=UPI0025D5989C